MAVTGERSGEPQNGGVFSAAVSENGAFAPTHVLDSRLLGGPRVYPCLSLRLGSALLRRGILDAEEAGGLFHDGE